LLQKEIDPEDTRCGALGRRFQLPFSGDKIAA